MLAKGDSKDAINDPHQIMSFGGDDASQSLAEKTTERESKNTTATMRTAGLPDCWLRRRR